MANTVQIVVSLKDNASSALSGITGALGNMASVAGGIVAADVLGRIGSGLAGVAAEGFNFNRAVENATARLNAFTKDTAVSAGILEDLRIEAAKTPFAFEDMANAGAALLPVANSLDMQLMDLVKTAEILAASNPAEGLEGAAFALKEAASGDFTSIIERFNLSRSAINALKEEGVPNMEIIARAMADMGLDMDLVGNLATTFDGRMSTLKDTITTAAGVFTQPIFDALSAQIFGLQGTLDENMPAIEEKLRNAGQFVADAFTTMVQAWNGQWVDDEVIQPFHRLVGTLTQDVKGAWDGLIEGFGKAQDFWQSGWLQEKVITPLSDLATMIAEDFVKDWQKLDDEWRDLNDAGEAWNELMNSGREMWSTIVGYAGTLGINLGTVGDNLGDTNVEMAKSQTLGQMLTTIFKGIAYIVDLVSLAILTAHQRLVNFIALVQSAITQVQNLGAAMQGQVYANGIPVGPAATPPPAPNYIPNSDDHSMVSGRGMMGRGMAGAPVIYATINNAMDIEELAYRVFRYAQDNR